jgi:hypothetical protein
MKLIQVFAMKSVERGSKEWGLYVGEKGVSEFIVEVSVKFRVVWQVLVLVLTRFYAIKLFAAILRGFSVTGVI